MKQLRNTSNDQKLCDCGNNPFVTNLKHMTAVNTNFRTSLWTGNNMQLTLMCIKAGEDIGLECHNNTDQFIKIESGSAIVKMGADKNELSCCERVSTGYAVIIPAGTWHNIINIGSSPLRVFSLYAPPAHHFGTVHRTKKDAHEEE